MSSSSLEIDSVCVRLLDAANSYIALGKAASRPRGQNPNGKHGRTAGRYGRRAQLMRDAVALIRELDGIAAGLQDVVSGRVHSLTSIDAERNSIREGAMTDPERIASPPPQEPQEKP